jgi:serine/threonine protein kinase/Tol biopolymer transport system component
MGVSSGTRLGPYEILSPLGAGGMGEVYRARDSRLGRDVAIKVLPTHLSSDPRLGERFEREARAISSLNDPHICHLYDVGSQDGIDYLVMEYLEGETLADRLQKGALLLDQVLKVGVEIADALNKAHRAGIVHRDLKPGNVMLTRSGAKLMDFGLAKTAAAMQGALPASDRPITPSSPTVNLTALAASPTSLSEKGAVLGTFQYMAPEVLQGQEADARSDIFGLGCVLYEMVTGRHAFPGKSQLSVLSAILEKDPDPIAKFQPLAPPVLDGVVRTCLSKSPEERWQSAADVAHSLQLLRSSLPISESRLTASRGLLYFLGSLCIVLAAVAFWFALLREKPSAFRAAHLGRFTFDAPTNAAVSDLAVSPDGRQIAFVNGESLWVRSSDSPAARKLPGTLGAHAPFWSPDGHSLGFVAAGYKLRRISLADNSVQDICDLRSGWSGMTWNQDQVILIGNYHGPILRVSANGGEPVALSLNSTHNEVSQRWPWFLPDGRHFLYLSASGSFVPTAHNREIDLGDLSGSPARRVVVANSNAQYSDGQLLYMSNGVLVAQSYDASSGKVSGDPSVIQSGVYFRAAFGFGYFSAANGLLAYSRTEPNSLNWIPRNGGETRDVGLKGALAAVDVAPDGTSAVVEITNEKSGNGELWLVDLQRNVATRLTLDDSSWNWDPVWSADGKRIYFSSTRSGGSDIYEREIGSSTDRLLFGGTNRLAPLDASRDGRYLLFEKLESTTGPDIWLLPLTGDRKPAPYIRTNYIETAARFSPDAKWVAYVSNESGAIEVYVESFPVPGRKVRISTDGGMDPRWRNDGRELYFIAADGQLMATGITMKPSFHATVPKPLFRIPTTGDNVRRNYWASPDGQRFLALQEPSGSVEQVNVIVNWAEVLRR